MTTDEIEALALHPFNYRAVEEQYMETTFFGKMGGGGKHRHR